MWVAVSQTASCSLFFVIYALFPIITRKSHYYWPYFLGNIHGAAQRPGILGNHRHYLYQPLWQGTPLTFRVAQARGPLRKDGELNISKINIITTKQKHGIKFIPVLDLTI